MIIITYTYKTSKISDSLWRFFFFLFLPMCFIRTQIITYSWNAFLASWIPNFIHISSPLNYNITTSMKLPHSLFTTNHYHYPQGNPFLMEKRLWLLFPLSFLQPPKVLYKTKNCDCRQIETLRKVLETHFDRQHTLKNMNNIFRKHQNKWPSVKEVCSGLPPDESLQTRISLFTWEKQKKLTDFLPGLFTDFSLTCS